ncbi:MAG: hypothetical protein KBT18_06220 [Comamonas sp.]|nr:hypothetical protein [Candidatus Comamonas equi]
MTVQRSWAIVAAACFVTSGAVAEPLDATTEKLVGFAASMTEMARACGHMSAAEIDTSKLKQRQAMLDEGTDAKAYDAAYAVAQKQFTQRWATMPKAQQQSTCDQVKKQSEMAAAQASKLAK